MKHYYYSIGEDWFTYPQLYREAVEHFNEATFVEVGSWRGRSACYMGVEILNQNKKIKMFCVDTWFGSEENQGHQILDQDGLYKEFIKNIEPLSDVISPIRKSSIEASKQFEDLSLDFVFIDASHDYNSVKQDLECWYPKVKPGGWFAGHDYPNWPGVVKAVDEWSFKNSFKVQIDKHQLCWSFIKK